MKQLVLLYISSILFFQSNAANAELIENTAKIENFTKNFKTFNGQKLTDLIGKYGLRITSIDTTPISKLKFGRKPGDRDGDIVVSIFISGNVKKMPCGLHKWLSQGYTMPHAEDIAEIIYRNGIWITDSPELDPLLYWAATGKCSGEYGLPW